MSFRLADVIWLPAAPSDPGTAQNGHAYYNTTTHKVRVYANGAWTDLGSGTSTGGGSKAFTFAVS